MKIKVMFIMFMFSFFTVAFDQSFSLRYAAVVFYLSLKR